MTDRRQYQASRYVGGLVGESRKTRLETYCRDSGLSKTEALKTALDMLFDYQEDGEL